jgi:hypothetical protein
MPDEKTSMKVSGSQTFAIKDTSVFVLPDEYANSF